MRKIVLTLISVLIVAGSALAQNKRVSGTVTNEAGRPLSGVSVVVSGANAGDVTDNLGKYTLPSVPENAKLLFSMPGMATQEMTVLNKSVIDVIMKEAEAEEVEEVMVIAYGTAKKRDLTGSVSVLTDKDLAKQTVSTVSRALEGTVAGVNVVTASGQPGSDAAIYVRGLGSINASAQPLIVLDGVPYPSSLNSINPSDIATITVSKDAAANAIYGSRAANGVVMVTSKQGAKGKEGRITYDQRIGVNQRGVPAIDRVGPGDFYEWIYEGLYNYGLNAYAGNTNSATSLAQGNLMPLNGNYMSYRIPTGERLIDPTTRKLNTNAELLYHDDWAKELFQNAVRQEYNLSVSGGTDRGDYYVSMGFLQDPSYMKGSGFDRYSGRIALNNQVKSWLKVGGSMAFTRRILDANANYNGAWNNENPFFFSTIMNPLQPLYARDQNGDYIRDDEGKKVLDYGSGQTYSPYGSTRSVVFSDTNPLSYIKLDKNEQVLDNISGRAYADLTFLKHFKFTANVSLDNTYSNSTTFRNPVEGFYSDPDLNGYVGKSQYQGTSLNTVQTLTYDNTFCGKHNINLLAGHEFNYYERRSLGAGMINVFLPDVAELNNAVTVDDNPSSTTFDEALEGYMFRASYNYDGKYYLEGSVRADGSSTFKYDKWGVFWSASAAWRISEESWFNNAGWVNDMKIRASYGTTGNHNVTSSSYPYTDLWTVTEVAGGVGITQTSTGNRNLTWETVEEFDLGVDFRLFNRLTGVVDVYQRMTKNMIWNRPTPISTGLSSRLENVGELRNRGLEVELNYNIIQNRDMLWSVGANIAFERTTLASIPPEFTNPYEAGSYLRGVGKPWYNLYTYKYAGVDEATGKALYWRTDADGKKIKDFYKNGTTIQATKYEMGDSRPDAVGGFNTYFRYKNFDASLGFSYQIGGMSQFVEMLQVSVDGRPALAVSKDRFKNSWTPENTNAKYPRAYYGGPNDHLNGDTYFRDASYLSLRSVNIGYTLPAKWTNKIFMESARIYLSGDNLWLKSAEKGFDPRTSYTAGLASASFSAQRTYSAGITLNF